MWTQALSMPSTYRKLRIHSGKQEEWGFRTGKGMWEKVMTWEWAWKTLKGHGILRTVVLVYEVKNVWYEVGNTYRLRFPLGDLQDTMQLSTLLTF